MMKLDQFNAARTADARHPRIGEKSTGDAGDVALSAAEHGDERERLVVMAELRKIAGLRLAQTVAA